MKLYTLLAMLAAMTNAQQRNDELTPDPKKAICPRFRFDAKPRLDCSRTTCSAPINSTRSRYGDCTQFCEVRRTGIIGEPQIPKTEWNGTTPGWEIKDLPGGKLIDVVLNGVKGGLSEKHMEAIRASLNFEFTVDPSPHFKTRTIPVKDAEYRYSSRKNFRKSAGHYSRWVYFPLLIESCGTLRTTPINTNSSQIVQPGEDCQGEVEEKENVCVTGAWTVNGEAVVGWAQMYEFQNGSVVDMGLGINQNEGYRSLKSGSVDAVYPVLDSGAGVLRVGSAVLAAALGALVLAL